MGWAKCFARWNLNWSFLHLCFTAVTCSKVCVTSPSRSDLGLLRLSPYVWYWYVWGSVENHETCWPVSTNSFCFETLAAVKSWLFCSLLSALMLFEAWLWFCASLLALNCLIVLINSGEAIRCMVQMHISGWQPQVEADKSASGYWGSLFCCCCFRGLLGWHSLRVSLTWVCRHCDCIFLNGSRRLKRSINVMNSDLFFVLVGRC